MNRTTRQMLSRAFTLMGSYDKEYTWREIQLRGNGLSNATRASLSTGMQRAARNRDRLHRFIDRMGRVS
jgi:hypothetical protein